MDGDRLLREMSEAGVIDLPPGRRARGIYFGPDATHATIRKRIEAFESTGAEMTAFTFRRTWANADFEPPWTNIHLGDTIDRNYLKRLPKLYSAYRTILRHRETLRQADFLYARNFDLILLALAVKRRLGLKIPLVYEIPDIQGVFFRKDRMGRLFRFVERRALRRIDLLVVSSPGYLEGYFTPVQNYKGRTFLLENKVLARQVAALSEDPALTRPAAETVRDRWIIGWHGTLRCPKSMQLLAAIADRMGDKVEIYTRGYPTQTGVDAYKALVSARDNYLYDGEYTVPDDLPELYRTVHFAWCIDFHDEGGNSELLLPNRIYQGGLFGAVPIALAAQATGQYVARHGLGFTVDEPLEESVPALLESLSWEGYLEMRQRNLAARDRLFIDDGRDIAALVDAILEPS